MMGWIGWLLVRWGGESGSLTYVNMHTTHMQAEAEARAKGRHW